MMNDWVPLLPHLNAGLNLSATVLLLLGFWAIKNRRESLHKGLMLGAFVISGFFLIGYLIRLSLAGNKLFPSADYPQVASWAYYGLLASHVTLAMTVPFVVIWAIILGLRNQRAAHRRVVRWAFPIWLYVSVTGVLVYLMLYWWFIPKT